MPGGLSDPALGVSVVVPCHNEQASIGRVVHDALRALDRRPCQVLVVDDGSTDDTASVAREAGADVLRLETNRGKGVALIAGAEAAVHPIVVFLDGDGQDDGAEITRLLDALDPDTDMVIGSRFLGTLHEGAIHPLNRLANVGFSRLISALFRAEISDSQAGFRAVSRDRLLALDLQAREYDIETDMLLKGLKAGWRVREIPVHRYSRAGSQTDFHRIRHGLLIAWTILRERVM